MTLKKTIEKYIPYDEQEERDKEQMLKFINNYDDVLTRNNIFGHFSASAFVINKDRTKMVVVYHIINGGWIYPGGHADGEEDLLSVAVREVEEETGLKAKALENDIYSIQSAPVKGHIKHGKYVSAHLHFDVLYIMEADDNIPLVYREDESKGVKWIPFEEADNETMCDFIRPIHKKLIKKLNDRRS
jgi:8-oxo-dGTP pyrophosphatase MutT (NUDIX family)